MTTFTMIVLIAFVACLAWQLMAAAQKSCGNRFKERRRGSIGLVFYAPAIKK